MAHFAELDATNTVINVVVVSNDVTTTDGVEDEQRGSDFLNGLYPDSGTWVQTSYNGNQRYRYAGIGDTYIADRDVFLTPAPPEPFPSWTLNEYNVWEPPVAQVDGYRWDEDTLAWVQPDSPFPSWTWTVNQWLAPTPYPDDGNLYDWDEDTTSWVEIEVTE